jgi:uncharacterized damage-inducible protein DinB
MEVRMIGDTASHNSLTEALTAAVAEQLTELSGMRGNSKLERLELPGWHDTYHTGQTAVYRRLAGLKGTLG